MTLSGMALGVGKTTPAVNSTPLLGSILKQLKMIWEYVSALHCHYNERKKALWQVQTLSVLDI